MTQLPFSATTDGINTLKQLNLPRKSAYVRREELYVDRQLLNFIEDELLPNSGICVDNFWQSLRILIEEFGPENRKLLRKRTQLQREIDSWHRNNLFDITEYEQFLRAIGYLEAEPEDFKICTENVDDEIATIAGPQLVVPVKNARFAINAVNARWGSLYDALYGTDAIAPLSSDTGYQPERGQKVIHWAKNFLDDNFPLERGSHHQAVGYRIDSGELCIDLDNGRSSNLASDKFKGYRGHAEAPTAILLKNNNLHIEIQFDGEHPIGKTDPAQIKDIALESAITTILDAEDSVAAVDAEDKTEIYRNLLGLFRGDIETNISKNGQLHSRRLNGDRDYLDYRDKTFSLTGRSLMLVRNVGHLMTTPAILDNAGIEIPEGILDALMTAVIGRFDLAKQASKDSCNSVKGSLYIVKPKMHGSREAAFTCELFARIEQLTQLPRNTMKIGIMDEERRTSLNLKACIYAARERLVFINTGFLDRTGDEFHTSMNAGAMVGKGEMRNQAWIKAYEDRNVEIGLACGLPGRAQIGKGMWAKPDEMAAMLSDKQQHIEQGASCAWVPSPTAATLHVSHYHNTSPFEVQQRIAGRTTSLTPLLEIPLMKERPDEQQVTRELENNAQSILGYVVRWIDHGVGCSKVPDIDNVALMEDRATLRISSQSIANWLRHGICTPEQVDSALEKMAVTVDVQNAGDHSYRPMSGNTSTNIAFQAARDLIFKGASQPSGYTEPLLHHYRRLYKQECC